MKMARIRLILFATSTALYLSMNGVHAQGTAFTYQGRLNVSGAPASGTYDFRYRLALDPYGNNYYGSSVLAGGHQCGSSQGILHGFGGRVLCAERPGAGRQVTRTCPS